MEETELDLREILRMLRRRAKLLVALPTAAALVSGVVSFTVLKPVYRAETTLWVIKGSGTGQMDYNELMVNRNLTKTYAEVAMSRAVMLDVMRRVQIADMTEEEWQSKLTVTTVRDTEILSLAVEDTDPQLAAQMADAVAQSFQGQIRSFMKVENAAVVDPAVVPTKKVKPRRALIVAIALVLGAMGAVALACLLEYLDTSIKSEEDATRHLGLPVLGTIPMIEGGELEPGAQRSSGGIAKAKKGVRV